MSERKSPFWLAAAALACVAVPAAALSITGLSPLASVASDAAHVVVQNGSLHIGTQQGAQIVVTPWPEYLPQRFGRQQISAVRTLHPAGPSDRIALRAGEAEPWLIVGTGWRSAQTVVGSWTLQRDDGRWVLRNGDAWRLLRPSQKTGRAVKIGTKGAHWCVYLLDTQPVPAASRGVASEGESQASLALVRADDGRCPRQGTGGR